MRVLLVSNQRQNSHGVGNPIMYRMLKSLRNDRRIEHAEFVPFYNSLSSFSGIRNKAKQFDVIHIHFGGLYALLIWFALIGVKCKKNITFHGTDIHAKAIKSTKGIVKKMKIRMNQYASFISISLFDKCGFVAEEMVEYVPKCLRSQLEKKSFVQPLGVDYEVFKIIDKHEAREHLGLGNYKYVLFSDVSNTNIKRRDIAEQIVETLGEEYKILIMCGVKPDMVPCYINACDFLLLTSDEEGSPNIIRECLALNKPVFSVQVGDAAKQLEGLANSCIVSRNPEEAASIIREYMDKVYIDNTRKTLQNRLDFMRINRAVIDLYNN